MENCPFIDDFLISRIMQHLQRIFPRGQPPILFQLFQAGATGNVIDSTVPKEAENSPIRSCGDKGICMEQTEQKLE